MRAEGRIIGLLFALCVMQCGCLSPDVSTRREEPSVLPGPSNTRSEMDIKIELPPELAGVEPSQLTGKLIIVGDARAVSLKPVHSTYSGTLTVTLRDPATDKIYLDYSSRVSGERDGTPNDAIFTLHQRLWDDVALQLRAIPAQPTTQPKSTSQPWKIQIRGNLDL